jgi:hypothetical protein
METVYARVANFVRFPRGAANGIALNAGLPSK